MHNLSPSHGNTVLAITLRQTWGITKPLDATQPSNLRGLCLDKTPLLR